MMIVGLLFKSQSAACKGVQLKAEEVGVSDPIKLIFGQPIH